MPAKAAEAVDFGKGGSGLEAGGDFRGGGEAGGGGGGAVFFGTGGGGGGAGFTACGLSGSTGERTAPQLSHRCAVSLIF
ncbi:MAG: hypothetical protein ACE15E_08070 [Acidobacteriota bacterium]